MIGSLITRALVLIFGYAYPAYECYKSVEMNKPDIEQLRFWCQYWILVAGLTVGERIGDMFIGWPYVAKHETEIDRNLLELRTRAGDVALSYWQKAASYAQTRVFDLLQYIASQSTPKQPAQPQNQGTGIQKPTATPPQDGQPPSPAPSTSSSDHEEDATQETGPSEDSNAAPAPAPAILNEQKTTPTQASVESSKTSISSEEQVMKMDSVPPVANESAQTSLQDASVEEARRLTRVRPRKTRVAATASNR